MNKKLFEQLEACSIFEDSGSFSPNLTAIYNAKLFIENWIQPNSNLYPISEESPGGVVLEIDHDDFIIEFTFFNDGTFGSSLVYCEPNPEGN